MSALVSHSAGDDVARGADARHVPHEAGAKQHQPINRSWEERAVDLEISNDG